MKKEIVNGDFDWKSVFIYRKSLKDIQLEQYNSRKEHSVNIKNRRFIYLTNDEAKKLKAFLNKVKL